MHAWTILLVTFAFIFGFRIHAAIMKSEMVCAEPLPYVWDCPAKDCSLHFECTNHDALKNISADHLERHKLTIGICICPENIVINDMPHVYDCPWRGLE